MMQLQQRVSLSKFDVSGTRIRARCGVAGVPRRPALRVSAAADAATLFGEIGSVLKEARELPPSMRSKALADASKTVRIKLNELKATGPLLWDSYTGKAKRRQIYLNDLKSQGIMEPAVIGVPSVSNDLNFVIATVLSTSLLAVVLGATLPGDWGFFSSYLVGGISLVVLAIGSTNPGVLAFAIDKFARVDPKYRDRILAHEAAHFLIGYSLGVPVTSYSVDIGTEHIEVVEASLQRNMFVQKLEDAELDQLAVVAMSGAAAEAMRFEDVRGQSQDLYDLQRMMNRSVTKLSASEQQNLTRWAVWQAAGILKANKGSHEALMEAMARNAPVEECFKIIEAAKPAPATA